MNNVSFRQAFFWVDDFLGLFYPNLCLACEKNIRQNEEHICVFCQYKLPKTNAHQKQNNIVEQKFWGRANFEKAAAFYFYEKGSKVQKLIQKLKYKNQPEIGVKLGMVYGKLLQTENWLSEINFIVPIPLHPYKKKLRGYNQAEKFASGIHSKTDLEVNTSILKKRSNSKSQTTKSRIARWKNVAEEFTIKDNVDLTGKHILLVDDVITTGATLEACCNLFTAKGAKVSLLAIAVASS